MIQPGSRLAHYEILSALGKGGMGEVWRARDTKLGREVAIKSLPAEFAVDADRLARFEREARLLASLNHPNIAAIYGFEEESGVRFLVMELVEGDTLADRLRRGAIPVEESLKIALQIAEALEAAHERSVIHRDLKPANIKITPDGRVKVLDFGLAKAFLGDTLEADPSNSPTLSMAATQQGLILGTAAYMSPEQAKGRPTDKRTDVWAFGCVFYEMLSGRQPFGGSDVSESLAAVIRGEPEWDLLPSGLSPTLVAFTKRCLEKDPSARVRDIGDVRLALEGAFDPDTKTMGFGTSQQGRPSVLSPAVAAVATAIIGVFVAWSLWPPPNPPLLTRFQLPIPLEHEFGDLVLGQSLAVSHDGRRIAYTTMRGLYVWSLDSFEPVLLVENAAGQLSWPFFSPDGTQVGFMTNRGVRAIGVGGGSPVTLDDTVAQASFGGATWGPNGTITLAALDGISQLQVQRPGERTLLIRAGPDETFHSPQVLPGGEAVLFVASSNSDSTNARIERGLLSTGDRLDTRLRGTTIRYLDSGHLLFVAAERLLAVEFDADRGTATGTAMPLGLSVSETLFVMHSVAHYDVSTEGTLTYIPPHAASLRQLRWFSRRGDPLEEVAEPIEGLVNVELSSDERRVLFNVQFGAGALGLWRLDLQRGGIASRLAQGGDAVWSSNDQRVAFVRPPDYGIFSIAAAGGAETILFSQPESDRRRYWLEGWSADETMLVALRVGADGDEAVLIALDADEDPVVFDRGVDLDEMEFSPGNQWITYNKVQEGRHEIFIVPNPPTGQIQQVSSSGGVQARWREDGQEIFYLRLDGTMMAVAFDPASGDLETPQPLFDTGLTVDPGRNQYDVSGDGQRFLIAQSVPRPESDRPRIAVEQQRSAEVLERRLVD